MSEGALACVLIDEFGNLQRIKAAQDREAEIKYQEGILKARMQSLGIPTDNLEIK